MLRQSAPTFPEDATNSRWMFPEFIFFLYLWPLFDATLEGPIAALVSTLLETSEHKVGCSTVADEGSLQKYL
jgi:hypothetical protein